MTDRAEPRSRLWCSSWPVAYRVAAFLLQVHGATGSELGCEGFWSQSSAEPGVGRRGLVVREDRIVPARRRSSGGGAEQAGAEFDPVAAAWLPAVAITLVGSMVYQLVATLALAPTGIRPFPNLLWTLLILWVAPALAAAALGAVVVLSARAQTSQDAMQLGGVLILPLVALAVAQATGVLALAATSVAASGAALWVLAGLLLRAGTRALQRDRLATRLRSAPRKDSDMGALPPIVWVIGGIALLVVVAVRSDLARHDARHLPKWAWALVIILGSLLLGPILWFALGRVPAGEEVPDPAPLRPAGSAVEVRPSTPRNQPLRPEPHPRVPVVLATQGLGKSYGDTVALTDVDLKVPRGSVYGLIGPNGAGKTTMLSMIAGLRRPTTGTIELAVPRRSLGVVVDTPLFEPWLTAWKVVDLARQLTAPEREREHVWTPVMRMNLWRLEVLRLTRTHRWMILFGVYAFFAVTGPLIAAYFNEVMARFGGEVTVIAPDPRPVDGLGHFIGNAGQLGVLAVVVVAAGALAFDAKPELAAFLRTRVERASTLMLPRYLVVTTAAVLTLVVSTLIAWVTTVALIGNLPVGPVVIGTLYGAVFLAFAVAVLAAVAGFVRSQAGAAFASLAVLLALPIVGMAPAVAQWLPSELLSAVLVMVEGAPASDFFRSLLVTLAATAALLTVLTHRLGQREL